MSKDYTGLKYGRLTFLHHTGKRTKDYKQIWALQCECGTQVEYRADVVANGNYVSCGCRRKEVQDSIGQLSRKYTPEVSAARSKWRRNYSDIDFDTFLTLSQLPCDYCKRLPHRGARISSKKEGISQTTGTDHIYLQWSG